MTVMIVLVTRKKYICMPLLHLLCCGVFVLDICNEWKLLDDIPAVWT